MQHKLTRRTQVQAPNISHGRHPLKAWACFGLIVLPLMGCDNHQTQGQSPSRNLTAKELGQRPPLSKEVDSRNQSSDEQFVSMVDESGRSARGRITKNTIGSFAGDPELGLAEFRCEIKAGTSVNVIGLEKSENPGDGLYLIQLREPCADRGRARREMYVEENALAFITSTDLPPLDSSTDPSAIPKTTTTTDTSTATNTGIGSSSDTGVPESNEEDSGKSIPTMRGCIDIRQIKIGRSQVGNEMVDRMSSGPNGCHSNDPGVSTKSGPFTPCQIPGPDFRDGAEAWALKIKGQAAQFKVQLRKEDVNRVMNEGKPTPPLVPEHSCKDGKPGEVGAAAPIRNCVVIPEKTVDASKYLVKDATDTYQLPLKDVLVRNDWGGAILVHIAVTALDSSGKPINTCTHETMSTSPIVLDFSHEASLATVSLYDSKARFDLKANGEKTRTGWITGKRGLLALDLNHDGLINDGSELFGEGTTIPSPTTSAKATNGYTATAKADNGYIALQQYDHDHRGYLDAKTAIFHDLVVWFDQNGDGVSQKGELVSVKELGITRIDTSYEEAPQYQKERAIPFANQVRWRSKFYDRSGCQNGCYSYDVYFANERVQISAVKSSP